MKEINIYDALKLMRKLSGQNFPVKIVFASCDTTRAESSGFVTVENCILTKGLPGKKSIHAKNLIAYEDCDTGMRRHFWLPLLLQLNDLKITHDRVYR